MTAVETWRAASQIGVPCFESKIRNKEIRSEEDLAAGN